MDETENESIIITNCEDDYVIPSDIKHYIEHGNRKIEFDDKTGITYMEYYVTDDILKMLTEWYNTEYHNHENVLPKFNIFIITINLDKKITDVKLITHCYFKHKKDMFLQHVTLDKPVTLESRSRYDIKITEETTSKLNDMISQYYTAVETFENFIADVRGEDK